MASIAASSTFHSLSTFKSPNLSSTHLLPLSKNLTFRTRPIGNSGVYSFGVFTKQSRLGLRKLSCLGEGGEDGVAIADEEQQQQQQQETVSVPVSPSDMLTMFFQADGTLNEAAIPNVTKALQDIDGVSNLKVQVSEGVAVVELSKQTTVQATGVASSLVETIQGAGFKLQTLNLSFEDEDEHKRPLLFNMRLHPFLISHRMSLSLLSVFIFLQVFTNVVFAASNEESNALVSLPTSPTSPAIKPPSPSYKPPSFPTTPIKPPTITPPVKPPTTPVPPTSPPTYKPPTVKPPTTTPVKPPPVQPPYKPPTSRVKPPTMPPVKPPPTYKPPTPPVKPPTMPPVKPPTAPVKPTPIPPYKAPPVKPTPPPQVTTPPPAKPPVNPIPSPPVNAPPVKPPYKPPTPPPVRPRINCVSLCGTRCGQHSRKNVCMRACVTCCYRCKCVPPGTYGNKEKCGSCYVNMKTRGGRPKCP
ncbi:unnamed protein product [Brassica rapa subsp. trilocularis]